MAVESKKSLKTVQGTGVVYGEGQAIARARYRLLVNQRAAIYEDKPWRPSQPDLADAGGLLRVIEGEIWLLGILPPLILKLEDGRQMEFYVKRAEYRPNEQHIFRIAGR